MDEHREEREELERIVRDDEDDAREQAEAFTEGRSAYDVDWLRVPGRWWQA